VITAIDALNTSGQYQPALAALWIIEPRGQRLDRMKDAILFRRPKRQSATNPRRLPGRIFLARIEPDHSGVMRRGERFRSLKGEAAAPPPPPSLREIPPALRRTPRLYPEASALRIVAADRHSGPKEGPNAVPLRFEHTHVFPRQTDIFKSARF